MVAATPVQVGGGRDENVGHLVSSLTQQIGKTTLRKLVDDASKYLGEKVSDVVITVPAYFDETQRQATRDAATIAGIEASRIVNEPTAASLAYGLEKKSNEKIAVFDLGGGTFDISIMELGDGVLGRLGLQLLRRGDVRHEGDVEEQGVLASDVVGELANGFEERQ